MMKEVKPRLGTRTLTLDVCTTCPLIWFDNMEIEALPKAAPPRGSGPFSGKDFRTDAARQAWAVAQIDRQARQQTSDTHLPTEGWQWVAGFFGLPIEFDAPQPSRRPWITWGIALTCVAVMLMTLENLEYIVKEWGFIPSQWNRHNGLTMITSFFLHGGIFHILGNMYFLMVFGDNVEDHLGRFKYLLLLAGAHAVGMAVHAAFDPNGNIPCVGASAGISGVIACYAVAFPKVRLGIMFRYFFYFRWFFMSAWVALLLYMALQLIGSFAQARGFAGVSYLAHMGGLIIGLLAGWAVHISRKQTTRTIFRDEGYSKRIKDDYMQ